ncbi:MAG TPA: hypothetical protein VLD62_09110, partial [Acidimicrobiia bacterium]|nr:hypothetical protein [Acidimicrobiia bacterium]
MTEDPAFLWDRPTRISRTPGPDTPPTSHAARAREEPPAERPHRITLRDAAARYGISVGTLRSWAKGGRIDAVKDDRGRWMADPASVAAETAQRAPTPPVTRAAGPAPATTGPTEDGTAMLVPRDAWDRLIDQLGNLHEAGLMLAEARERAVKAETEATFLRERLADMRTERDRLRDETAAAPPQTARGAPSTQPPAPLP